MKKLSPLLVFFLFGLALPAAAKPVETISIDQIRPGMTGYGLTVFSGFKIERFKVEVVDIIRNFLPRQDIFLVRIDHPVLRKTGVVGGMSGSPIYLQGKLAGALAYGWRFAKEPICGITPIKNMLDLLKHKPRGPGRAGWAAVRSRRVDDQTLASLSRSKRWWKLPFTRPTYSPATIAPVAVPLNIAGFPSATAAQIREAFAEFGLEPMAGGGTGQAEGPTRFEPGGAVGVQMISGDMSMAGTGTVTWVDRMKVLGFGHRMFNAGEVYIPAVTARVHHTLANVARSFKIASPARRLGALVQDRQAGILVDSTQNIGTIPVQVTMRFSGRKETFKTQVARHRLLTPTLISTVVSSALGEALPDVDQATFTLTTRFTIRGQKPVRLVDHLYAPGGVSLTAMIFSRGVLALRQVLANDFQPVYIERYDADIKVDFRNDVVEIIGVKVASTTVKPGAKINLTVIFRPFKGRDFQKTYTVRIPASLDGSLVQLEVASGSLIKPDLAGPQNLSQLLQNLQEDYSARSIVISLATPQDSLALRGHVVRSLPPSVIDTLSTAANIRDIKKLKSVWHQAHGTRRIIAGKKSIRIRVNSEVSQ